MSVSSTPKTCSWRWTDMDRAANRRLAVKKLRIIRCLTSIGLVGTPTGCGLKPKSMLNSSGVPVTRQKFEARYKGDENIDTVEFGRRPVQFLYRDADGCTFMDRETYEQHTLADDMLEEELKYLDENLEGILAMVADGAILGIELPATVNLEITETAPAMKAASSSARTKPATLSTGLVVQVPEYLTPGEIIKVNTASGEFVSRA